MRIFLIMAISVALGIPCYSQENPHRDLKLDCQECHTSLNWTDIRYDHQKTGFVLDGRHTQVACISCHSLENFSVVSKECVFCHVDIHQGKMARACEQCHSTRSWNIFSTTRAHANTTFPLIGAHAKLDCRSCHLNEIEGEFSMLKSECISCHDADFNAAQNPSHSALGFGTRCNDCHPAQGDYSLNTMTCFSCHEHDQGSTDSRHREAAGYVYQSSACYSCHRSGSAGG